MKLTFKQKISKNTEISSNLKFCEFCATSSKKKGPFLRPQAWLWASAIVQSLLHHPTLHPLSPLTYRPIFVLSLTCQEFFLSEDILHLLGTFFSDIMMVGWNFDIDEGEVGDDDFRGVVLETVRCVLVFVLGWWWWWCQGCCVGDSSQKKRQTAAKVYVAGNCGLPWQIQL